MRTTISVELEQRRRDDNWLCQQDPSKSVPAVLTYITKFTAPNLLDCSSTQSNFNWLDTCSNIQILVVTQNFQSFALYTWNVFKQVKDQDLLQFTTQLVYFVRLSTRNKLHSCLLQPISSFAYRIVRFMVFSKVLKFFFFKDPDYRYKSPYSR